MSEHPLPIAPEAPAPAARRRATRAVTGLVAGLVVAVGGVAGFVTASGASSSDGTFSTGDCVTLTASAVHLASCGSAHDGRITAVLHQTYASCPAGSDEFDVTDSTGNLCVDRSDASH